MVCFLCFSQYFGGNCANTELYNSCCTSDCVTPHVSNLSHVYHSHVTCVSCVSKSVTYFQMRFSLPENLNEQAFFRIWVRVNRTIRSLEFLIQESIVLVQVLKIWGMNSDINGFRRNPQRNFGQIDPDWVGLSNVGSFGLGRGST